MSPGAYLRRTLVHHWRTNLAVLLGVAAGTAVLTGALLVGDSVRGSLRQMTLDRLGKVDHVLSGPRFVRQQLAADIQALPRFRERFDTLAPAIMLAATVQKGSSGGATDSAAGARAGGVQLYGLSADGWELIDPTQPAPTGDQLTLNDRLARQLGVSVGDQVTVQIELPSDIPRDTLLGKKDGNFVEWQARVGAILPAESGPGRFGLVPNQQLPLNAFADLAPLQEQLGLAAREPGRRDPTRKEARVNAFLVSEKAAPAPADIPDAGTDLNRLLAQSLQPADLNLRVVPQPKQGYLSVESERMILDRQAVLAVERAARETSAELSPVLVYIANRLRKAPAQTDAPEQPEEKLSRYSVVAGVEPRVFNPDQSAPFGPYVLAGNPGTNPLLKPPAGQPEGRGVLINDWLAQDLQVQPGDRLELTWHKVGSHGELPEEVATFVVRGILPLDGTLAADRGLVPEVPGITNVQSFEEWDAPFPMKKVTPRDDDYWKQHRATPKVFLPLTFAQELWRNRYGELTSLRVAPKSGSLEEFLPRFTDRFRLELKPADQGLAFRSVKAEGLQAAAGTTDFGGLFLGFSLFLILSAAILSGLLFRLGIDRRAKETGLLLATGLGPRQVRRLLLAEGGLVTALGVLLGLLLAVAYARLMVHGLKTWWVGAIGTQFLELHISPLSPIIGGLISAGVALLSIVWGLRGLLQIAPRRLLSGISTPVESVAGKRARGRGARRWALGTALLAALLTAATLLRLVPNQEAFSGFNWPTILFFLVGLLTLVAGLCALGAWLDGDRGTAVRGHGARGIARLGARNASRNRTRSLLSAALIATATFLIVAIAAGHRNPAVEIPDRNSGNGGFTLVAESSVPVLRDLNSPSGRSQLGLDDAAAQATLEAVRQVVPFRVNPGENASCLNIYKTSQPTILGAPPEMLERGGFRFADTRVAEPWKLLAQVEQDGSIPVLGDLNTLQYSLHIGLGSTLPIRGEDGVEHTLKVVGMFDSSVFQGVLVMHQDQFQRLFPSRVGGQYFLIDLAGSPPPGAQVDQVSRLLESRLPGFDAERVADRLTSFLAVQNTYLSTFQALGGLGLLLGTIGLATVMLRNVLERRAELALLKAVGFRQRGLVWMVLVETALLLGWGLVCGTVAALLAMGPHLLSRGADIPWLSVLGLLAGVFAVGLLAAGGAARAASRTPLLATLRSE
ncbi:MAG: FtsX-like permease family protein [Planctomycetaceae bacterium]